MYAIVIGATATAICLCIVHRHQAIVTRGRWVISHVSIIYLSRSRGAVVLWSLAGFLGIVVCYLTMV